MNTKSVTINTFPVTSILGLIFITMKLTNYIDWSWWLVLLPFYGFLAFGLAFAAICLLFAGACFGIVGVVEYYQNRNDEKQRIRNRLINKRD